VLGDDAAPDADGVELGMLLAAGLLLLRHEREVEAVITAGAAGGDEP
jgi:hypothetical protein